MSSVRFPGRRIALISNSVAICACLALGSLAAERSSSGNAAQLAGEILDATGVQGGLIVHIGATDGRLTLALAANERYMVQGLARDAESVDTARAFIQEAGLYGPVSVDRLLAPRLPYIDNLVNLVVAEDLGEITRAEIERVLAPEGVAYINQGGAWEKIIKPRPAEIDDWTHYLHGPGGNAVAHDSVAGPPRRLQWVGSPRRSRHHDRMGSMSAMVSVGGRVFYIMDEGSRVSIQLPPRWTLIARDAFNGTVLWKRPIESWHNHLWPLKSGPSQLARRLVAVDDRVYVTLGLRAPLTALDAATGETRHVYERTTPTEEIIVDDGVVVALVNPGESELVDYRPQQDVGDQRRVAQEYQWNEAERQIAAIDPESGATLWHTSTRVAPLTLSAANERVFFHDGEKVVCLDRASGDTLWTSPPAPRRERITMNFGPKLVVHEDVVLFAGGEGTMHAYAAKDGRELWSAPHPASGYQSPQDLFVVAGLVWSAHTTRTADSGVCTGRDVRTGEIKHEFAPDVDTYWFHHRCYQSKATDRYLLASRTGVEFVDLEEQNWDINHWVRGGCLYGVMPCNGLVYAPPHNCACYPEAKLYGLNALAPEPSDADKPDSSGPRLERGPAYTSAEQTGGIPDSRSEDWPAYRHDRRRSGRAATQITNDLQQDWATQLGGRLSSVTIADGRLFVAQIDQHTVHALDAATGESLWSYTTGGRVDSPPTCHAGRILFGSADGWVYALRASDGELAWRFRAAPYELRLTAYEQIESAWPVHGSVLVDKGVLYVVAGRSSFLDGGLRLYRLEPQSGELLSEHVLDDRDPETGESIQNRIKILNMPVALPDILSSDDEYVYMRSQRFVDHGSREELGPHAGEPPVQGSQQHGAGAHLFAPMGFLDDTWFHRSYWVYGRSFAGGHAGYYQAGKYAPSGRILVFDDERVYGFGRKPQYYRWTTTLEHQLFATGTAPPVPPEPQRGGDSQIAVAKSASLDPTGTPLSVEAWVKPESDGVVLAHGGPEHGYALVITEGRPLFVARINGGLHSVRGPRRLGKQWVHLAGTLSAERQLKLYVDGEPVAMAKAAGLLSANPAQAMEIGADARGAVGNYRSPNGLKGSIDEVRVYHAVLSDADVAARAESPDAETSGDEKLVLEFSFNSDDARDSSGANNNGRVQGAVPVAGKFGRAMHFAGRPSPPGSFVEHDWNKDLPFFVRAMVLASDRLFVAGPPDLIDEEETFRRITAGDPTVQPLLREQEAALQGAQGGTLRAVSTGDGSTLAEYELPAPPVWDGMAAAGGRLYIATVDGHIVSLTGDAPGQ